MLHSMSLRFGVQTLILMQNPITKAREAKAKTFEMCASWIHPSNFSFICNYMQFPDVMDVYCQEIFSNFWSLVRLRAADQFASTVQYKARGHSGENGEKLETALHQLSETSYLPSDLYLGNYYGCTGEANIANVSQRHVLKHCSFTSPLALSNKRTHKL